jgi:GT2 family glycosyltransferase
MDFLDCSIIIPTYNTCAITLQCIRSLKQSPPRIPHEIIVVDNHSSDETVRRLAQEFPDIQLIQNAANLGFSKACNLAAKKARGRYLCFLNSDTSQGGLAVDRLVSWLEKNPGTGIAGPELHSPDGSLIQMSWVWNPILEGELFQQYLAPYSLRRWEFKRRCVAWLQRKSRHVSIICGACLMIRRKAYDAIGGFDENFELYFEDSDLCYRCGRAGWKNDFVADAKITHHLGQSTTTLGSWTVTSLIYQQSHLAYYRKHAPFWALWLLKAYLLLKWLRLRYVVAFKEKEGRERSVPYCRAYLRIIFELQKITLEEGVPQ